MDLLMEAARRYFGSSSDIRETELPDIQRRNEIAREAADRARKNRRRGFRKHLKEQRANLTAAIGTARALQAELAKEDGIDREALTLANERFQALRGQRDQLRLPPIPAKLGDDEEEYRSFRDAYSDFVARLESLGSALATLSEKVGTQSPLKIATTHLQSNQAQLNEKLLKYLKQIKTLLEMLREIWTKRNEADRAIYFERAHAVLGDFEKGSRLATVLNTIDAYYYELDQSFTFAYDPFLRTLENLAEGIDLESALSVTDDERIQLEDKLTHVHSLAQLGITVEIIGHELETLDAEVGRNLKRLPLDVQKLQAFTTGTIFTSVEDNIWWVCVSPACDMVPRQPSDQKSWQRDLHPIRPMMALRLEPITVPTALKEAEQGRVLFVNFKGTRHAFRMCEGTTSQLRTELFLLVNEGRTTENADQRVFAGSRIILTSDSKVLALKSSMFSAVAQLRDSYAGRLLQQTGNHTSRIGVDFVKFPVDK